ncbi:MAG TPA: copper homeostasis protein CutC [Terriglobia bacterium]|nr:copper homeostasis protein CutC [Terriglobia bacterium]
MNQTPGLELEVICCTVEDAIAASQGGATRLEVTVQLDLAGLTPPLELVRAILQSVPVPARVMLRERAGFEVGSPDDLESLRRLARQFATMGVDGLVTGYVKDGRLDVAGLRSILAEVPQTCFTIHHAIETTGDPLAALQSIREFGNADRCLVHGGYGTVKERIARLQEYRKALGPERRLILGGRLNLPSLPEFVRGTEITEIHLGRAVRTPERTEGRVDAAKVRSAMRLLQSCCGR